MSRRTGLSIATALVVAIVLGIFVGRMTISGARQPTSASTSSSYPIKASVGLAGTWDHHGLVMTVQANGYGQFSWRTYATCGKDKPPCDLFIGNNIYDGGLAIFKLMSTGTTTGSGQVVATTQASTIPLGRFSVRLDRGHDVLVLAIADHGPTTMCGPNATGPRSAECGA